MKPRCYWELSCKELPALSGLPDRLLEKLFRELLPLAKELQRGLDMGGNPYLWWRFCGSFTMIIPFGSWRMRFARLADFCGWGEPGMVPSKAGGCRMAKFRTSAINLAL